MIHQNEWVLPNIFQIHYLMCLAANYAHIRNQEKFLQFQDLQMLNDNDMLSAKGRF